MKIQAKDCNLTLSLSFIFLLINPIFLFPPLLKKKVFIQDKEMWYIYTMKYYSAMKKNEIMSFAVTWMPLKVVKLSEVSQRKTNIIWYLLYVESKKIAQMNLFIQQKEL